MSTLWLFSRELFVWKQQRESDRPQKWNLVRIGFAKIWVRIVKPKLPDWLKVEALVVVESVKSSIDG
jgi:hypothetical protein